MEEVVTLDFNYAEICALLESGTVAINSNLYVKLKAARDRFKFTPKMYGNGYGFSSVVRVIETGDSELSANSKIIVKD